MEAYRGGGGRYNTHHTMAQHGSSVHREVNWKEFAFVTMADAAGVKPGGMVPPFAGSKVSKLWKSPQLLVPDAMNTDTVSGKGLLSVKLSS